MKNYKTLIVLFTTFLFFSFIPPVDEEGMFPLSEIQSIELNEAGLKIPVSEVFNPGGISLIDALVKVGGCTGSFVSPDGLILTNHHCSFSAVQAVSTTEKNYLEDGFLAQSKEEELPAKGLTCRITESYEDVSGRILKAADLAEDIEKRAAAVNEEIEKVIKEEEEKNPGIEAEVSEMFVGKTYILFRYRVINDVRLVYVPPRAIGEFGGETDNWVWPRHTGDFSFLRAYVAPDGSPAAYSESNVPYHPKKYITVNADGADEGDFVFILGYPGKTYRHLPTPFLQYQVKYQLPYIQEMYEWLINLYEEKGESSPEFALKISPTIKSLANAEKNYRSKLIGIKRLGLIEKKKEEEERLREFINSSHERRVRYGNLLQRIEEAYEGLFEAGRRQFIYKVLRNVKLYRLAELMLEYSHEIDKPMADRKSMYRDENLNAFNSEVNILYSEFYPEPDKKILDRILSDAKEFPETAFKEAFLLRNYNSTKDFAETAVSETFLSSREKYYEIIRNSPENISDIEDPMLEFARKIYQMKQEDERETEIRNGRLNVLLAQYVNAKQEMMNTSFIPDANSTLRLTYGYIKGYSPADAVYYSPITTLRGLIEKGRDSGDYQLPEKIRKLYDEKDFGMFIDPSLKDVPVAILYSLDTTGGNSGSPVLDAYGQLIGLNFDRAFEATINDYAWSETYSRSIGVDIRYILWVVQKIGSADYLLKEMNISG